MFANRHAGAWRGRQHRCLVRHAPISHATLMRNRRSLAAGGIFLFPGPVFGAVHGFGRGEPILWMLYRFGAGVALAILVWLVDHWRA